MYGSNRRGGLMLSASEKKYLEGKIQPSDRYKSVLNARIRKKAPVLLEDLSLICCNSDKIAPSQQIKSWDDVKIFCNTVDIT